MENGFLFVANYIDILSDLTPFEIAEGYMLRRAYEHEISNINSILGKISLGFCRKWMPYNSKAIKGDKGYSWKGLPHEQWKYWVVGYKIDGRHNDMPDKIRQVCLLLNPEIEFCIEGSYYGNESVGGSYGIPSYYIEKYTNPSIILKYTNGIPNLVEKDLKKIKAIYHWIDTLNEKYVFLKYAVEQFYHLHTMSPHSPLSTLGYFSILESLVTHDPNRKKTKSASITHQLTNKIIFLKEIFLEELMPSPREFFHSEKGNEKLWKNLYKYRSHLAHGNKITFEESDFQPFSNTVNVLTFIKQITKCVLLFGLEQPKLLFYLREC